MVPKVAISKDYPQSITSLAAHFKALVSEDMMNDLDDEYRSFCLSKGL